MECGAGKVIFASDSQALQEAGCFGVVLECIPPIVAAAVTRELSIPTIGIGAGPFCSGQVCTSILCSATLLQSHETAASLQRIC